MMVYIESENLTGLIPSYQGKKRGQKAIVSSMAFRVGMEKLKQKQLEEKNKNVSK